MHPAAVGPMWLLRSCRRTCCLAQLVPHVCCGDGARWHPLQAGLAIHHPFWPHTWAAGGAYALRCPRCVAAGTPRCAQHTSCAAAGTPGPCGPRGAALPLPQQRAAPQCEWRLASVCGEAAAGVVECGLRPTIRGAALSAGPQLTGVVVGTMANCAQSGVAQSCFARGSWQQW